MVDNFKSALLLSKAIRNGDISASYAVEQTYRKILDVDGNVNAFVRTTIEDAMKTAEKIDNMSPERRRKLHSLSGVPIVVKDNIVTKDIPTTAASRILQNWIPPYDSRVVQILREELMPIIGKTNLDEFAMGSATLNPCTGNTTNIVDNTLCVGGSSGGSAASVQSKQVHLAIGSDTGGSVRQPAALCGIFGYKPTYGAISRYGLIAFGSSLDQIGILASNIEDLAALYSTLAQSDDDDLTSKLYATNSREEKREYKVKKIGIIKNYCEDEELDRNIHSALNKFIKEKISGRQGYVLDVVEEECFDNLIEMYRVISYAEAFSNLNRYDGTIYGKAAEKQSTVERYRLSFGGEVRRRIVSGNMLLSEKSDKNYYRRAVLWRKKLIERVDQIFKSYSILICPTIPYVSLSVDQVDSIQNHDKYSVLGNLAMLPAISIPMELAKGKHTAVQLYAGRGGDDLLLSTASDILSAHQPSR